MNAIIVEGIERRCVPACPAARATIRLTPHWRDAALQDWQLFAICVLIWGTTWHAITYQVSDLAPEFGVALRFGLAGCSCSVCALARHSALRLSLRRPRALALQGAFMYGVSYICVYHAERTCRRVSSRSAIRPRRWSPGSVRARCSASRSARRFMAGGLLGLRGRDADLLARVHPSGDRGRAVLGAQFTVASVLLSAIGSLVGEPQSPPRRAASAGDGIRHALRRRFGHHRGVRPGRDFALPSAPSWWLSLAWLAFAGSAVALFCVHHVDSTGARRRRCPCQRARFGRFAPRPVWRRGARFGVRLR